MSAILAQARIVVNINTTKINQQFHQVKGRTQQFAHNLKNILAGAFSLEALRRFGLATFEITGNIEKATIAMKTFLGSAAAASAKVAEIRQLTRETAGFIPVERAAEFTQQMLGAGHAAEDVVPLLKAMGNAIAGVGRGTVAFQQLVLAMNQIKGQGVLRGQEMRQLTETTVIGIRDIAEQMGIATNEVHKFVAAGKVSYEDVAAIFMRLSAEGGRFNDAMIKQGKGLAGTWNRLKVAVQDFQIAVGKALGPRLKKMMDQAIKLVKALEKAFEGIVKIFEYLNRITYGFLGNFVEMGAILLIIHATLVSIRFALMFILPWIFKIVAAMSLWQLAVVAVAAALATVANEFAKINKEIDRSAELDKKLNTLRDKQIEQNKKDFTAFKKTGVLTKDIIEDEKRRTNREKQAHMGRVSQIKKELAGLKDKYATELANPWTWNNPYKQSVEKYKLEKELKDQQKGAERWLDYREWIEDLEKQTDDAAASASRYLEILAEAGKHRFGLRELGKSVQDVLLKTDEGGDPIVKLNERQVTLLQQIRDEIARRNGQEAGAAAAGVGAP